jgi:CelD/BcsL family acetyltransferase involved in cellulose biosynthesis
VHSKPNLRFVLHKTIPDDADLRQQWNALLATLNRPQVFYTYEWSLAVQRAYQATLRPLLFLAYDSQESLCGIAALALSADRDGKDEVSFLCATTGDYCDFLCSPTHKAAFVAGVLAELKKHGIANLTLTNLPADSGTLEAIQQAAAQNGLHCFARTAYVCAQISLEKLERRPGKSGPVLPRKKMVRRFLNAMGREAPVSLDHRQTWEAIQPLLPAFIRGHVARFLLTGRISNLVRPERQMFLEELARLLAEPGWIALTQLSAGDKTYAWNYGFRFQDTWFWYQPTFDTDIEKYSPGFCLLSKIVEEAAEDHTLRTVDMGLGDEDYKERFCNQTQRTLYVTLRSSAAWHAKEILQYRTARTVKASAALEAGFRAGESRLKRMKAQVDRDGWTGAATRVPRRLRESLWSEEEVFFFQWSGRGLSISSRNRLVPLDANRLADAAMQYHGDSETLAYLLRSAARLREQKAEGFVLLDPYGKCLHFGWATAFAGFFLSELNAKVDAPSANSVMLYDCCTPLSVRGHGHYAETITLIAEQVAKQGKAPWIFSAARNVASLRGLEKSGFQRRYSLTRKRAFLWQRIKGETPKLLEAPAAEVSARG